MQIYVKPVSFCGHAGKLPSHVAFFKVSGTSFNGQRYSTFRDTAACTL
jgi:hypothetical protein